MDRQGKPAPVLSSSALLGLVLYSSFVIRHSSFPELLLHVSHDQPVVVIVRDEDRLAVGGGSVDEDVGVVEVDASRIASVSAEEKNQQVRRREVGPQGRLERAHDPEGARPGGR